MIAVLLEELNAKHRSAVKVVHDEVLEAFRQYAWPGNIRELRNMLERAVITSSGEVLRMKDLSPEFGLVAPAGSEDSLRMRAGLTIAEAERRLILETLTFTRNNKTCAAAMLGIRLKTLHNKLKEYETQPQS